MARRSLLVMLTIVTALGSTPSEAKAPPRGDVDALALLAMAPKMCGLDTKRRWDAAMTATAARYGITIPALTGAVKKAVAELRRGLEGKPDLIANQCATIRRTQ